MANLTVLLNTPAAPVTFTIPSVSLVKQVDWTVFWDFTFGGGGSVNFAPVGAYFKLDNVVPLTINGVKTTVVPGVHYPVPEGGSGIGLVAFGLLALASALVRRKFRLG